ncbi:MAG: glycoside hydrolase family 3 C-terminal domain-containing protein [Clostridiales bacterium]|nr:glycoside hydrolase family 3 C-terminal domain-containing protein [Clostridiales bacterium]
MSDKSFIDNLISQMTLEEKAAQMVQIPVSAVGMEESLKWAEMGAGSFLNVFGDDIKELQKAAMEKSRLKIPAIFGTDAVRGHAENKDATIFPSSLTMAATWDRDLLRQVAAATAAEVATDGLHWDFAPLFCLARDPRWGRTGETFGEDKYLAGELGAAQVRGYQGDDLSADDTVLACAKHYIAYGEATGARDSYDTEVTFRKIRDEFLSPFRKAIEAGCGSFMTAYGSIDGTPLTANKKALRDILRDELGFDGIVVTDWDTVNYLVVRQKVCKDINEASRAAASAGNDIIMCTSAFYDAVIEEVREGRLEEKILDDAVRHILSVKLKMKLWDKPIKKGIPGSIGCKAHLELAKKAAENSVIMLKNDGVLPISFNKKIRKIAVIGPNANDIRAQYGDWTYFTHPLPGVKKEPARPYVTLLEGVRAQTEGSGIKVEYAYGCAVNRPDYHRETKDIGAFIDMCYEINEHGTDNYKQMPFINEAASLARESDLVILALGDNYTQAGEYTDRADLDLSGMQEALVRIISGFKVPIITVLIATKPLAIPDVVKRSDAVVCAFNGGMFGGEAVAEVLFGKKNPEGRLPISFPVMTGQVPVYYNQLPGWHEGRYVDCPKEPLFVFGEGLSYTWYEYSGLKFDAGTKTVTVTVANTGDMKGTETVQIYINDKVSSIMTADKNLAGFEKVELEPGESREVSIRLDDEAFEVTLPDETRVIEHGEFDIMAGHSSRDEDLIKITVVL